MWLHLWDVMNQLIILIIFFLSIALLIHLKHFKFLIYHFATTDIHIHEINDCLVFITRIVLFLQ